MIGLFITCIVTLTLSHNRSQPTPGTTTLLPWTESLDKFRPADRLQLNTHRQKHNVLIAYVKSTSTTYDVLQSSPVLFVVAHEPTSDERSQFRVLKVFPDVKKNHDMFHLMCCYASVSHSDIAHLRTIFRSKVNLVTWSFLSADPICLGGKSGLPLKKPSPPFTHRSKFQT